MTATEWADLAIGANSASDRYSPNTHPCGVPLLLGTLGICFCPLCYLGLQVEPKVNEDLAKLPVVAKLNERGITLYWMKKSKFDPGGLMLTFSQTTPVAPTPAQESMIQPQQSMLQVVVPPGLQAGAAFIAQTPTGQQFQVFVPSGTTAGDTVTVAVPPAQQVMTR